MAMEGGGKEMNEIKTQFTTREGLYKQLQHSEYSRPNRVPFNSQGSNPVRVSFINLNDQSGNGDRLCFNVGRELYFYIYKGVRKAADLSKPIDKRIYKGTQPTCHDFNHLTATAESVSLLVGFSAGQVQLIDPIKKETSKLFNEDNGNSVTTPGNSVPPPLPRSHSLPHSAVLNAGSKSSVMDRAIASGVSKFATLSLHDRKERHHEKDHKRNHSMGHIFSKSSDKLNLVTKTKTDPAKTLGTPLCPRMEDVPLLEPLICKKIAHERLTVLIFLEDCIVTACQEGFICTWGRPGKVVSFNP
ncbi:WD repeat-containing protein 20-like [Octodon degus]|uniref:WD repeat-containing protein 20-like n=1 Tax=Octodon degus TaxID=10160 RepID=A0A6P3F0Z1_OCTDE|nr:WD repeat-containing protein 20-like [Octodon degus]